MWLLQAVVLDLDQRDSDQHLVFDQEDPKSLDVFQKSYNLENDQ